MRENEINELINAALNDAPPAPDELRHNVMSAITELEYVPKRPKTGIFKTVSSIVGVAVFAVIVVVGSYIGSNDTAAPQLMSGGAGIPASMNMAPPDAEAMPEGGVKYYMNDDSDVPGFETDTRDQTDIVGEPATTALPEEAAQKTAAIDYTVNGILPEELDGLPYSEDLDGSRTYENVPDDIIEMMLANNSNVYKEKPLYEIAGNVVRWEP